MPQIVSSTSAACNIYSSHILLCPIFGIMTTAKNGGRGRHSQFFGWGLRAGASGGNVSRPTTLLLKGNKKSGVSGGIYNFYFIFMNKPIPGTLKHALERFAHMLKIWLSRANIKSFVSPNVDPILKQSYYKATTLVGTSHLLFARNSKNPRRFWEIYPDMLDTCSMSLFRPVNEGCSIFFRPIMWDSLRPK